MVNVMGKQLIPAGYKLTEVGVIPEDWQDSVIGSVAEFVGGSQPPKSTFKSIESPGYIRLIQIRDYKKDTYITFIPEHLAQKKCNSEDIMIGRYGPPIFQILRGIKGAYNVALIKAIPNEKIVRDFLFYSLKSERLFQLMEILSQRSSGQTGVDLPALKAYPLALPVREEQTAIATALFDVDALIAALEKLINKKSAIKTAAMQQLLTGKKRLPPFDQLNTGYKQTELGEIPGDWEVLTVGSLAEVIRGASPRPKGDKRYYGGNVPRLMVQDVTRDGMFVTPSIDSLTEAGAKLSRPCAKGTLTLVCSGTVGVPSILAVDACIHDGFLGLIKLSTKVERDYLYQFFKTQQEKFDNAATHGGVFTNLTTDGVRAFLVPLPPSDDEQIAIANVLADMDRDLEALQQRLHKTQQIKQGMMQELLTGKTRLV